jgi:hypothetical protein
VSVGRALAALAERSVRSRHTPNNVR